MVQKKAGRPPDGDKPLTERLAILISDETKDKLAQCRKATGLTKSDIVRRGIDRMYDELVK